MNPIIRMFAGRRRSERRVLAVPGNLTKRFLDSHLNTDSARLAIGPIDCLLTSDWRRQCLVLWNLRDLEYVVAVADYGHFGRAAAACHVSQPTLSGQILKLETELGLRLFDREGGGVRVSDRAATVVAQARATLAAAAGVTASAQAARDPFSGKLRLGIISTVAPYLLPVALPELAGALPRTPLYLMEDLTDRLLARLRDGALDAAVIATEPREARLTSIGLYDEPFFLVFVGQSGKPGRGSIGVNEIDPGALLLLADGHCLRDQTLALCGAAERTALGADVRGTSLETLRHLAAAGRGQRCAPPRLCRLAPFGRGNRGLADRRRRRLAPRQARLQARLAAGGRARGARLLAALDRRRRARQVVARNGGRGGLMGARRGPRRLVRRTRTGRRPP